MKAYFPVIKPEHKDSKSDLLPSWNWEQLRVPLLLCLIQQAAAISFSQMTTPAPKSSPLGHCTISPYNCLLR